MTVGELIEKLKEFPQDDEIRVKVLGGGKPYDIRVAYKTVYKGKVSRLIGVYYEDD